jgi:signal peptidase II|tara:strand:+ start:911 stop:1456 length:546 start_codon:yes stop_codon:yes gene_type:complete
VKKVNVLFKEEKLPNIKFKNLLNHFIIIILIFITDRASKIYLLNLHENGTDIDFYIFPFLNIYLIWNTGIGFGLFSTDPNIFYHFLTALIGIINLVLIILLFNLDDIRKYFISMIIGGSFGNFFDRIYYFAVPDFLDLHVGNFHWFIFNIADIFITIGIICLILVEISSKNINKEHNAKNI